MANKKYFDVVYTTKSGKTMIAKRVEAVSAQDAKDKLKKQMKASTTFDKVVTAVGLNGALPKGMTKVVARNIKIEGLSKTTGRILKGYYYGKGGKIMKSQALKDKEKAKTCKK